VRDGTAWNSTVDVVHATFAVSREVLDRCDKRARDIQLLPSSAEVPVPPSVRRAAEDHGSHFTAPSCWK